MIFNIQNQFSSASIDSLGAQLISFQDATGREYMWQRNPDVWSGCSPILFPIVGNCRDDKTIIEGESYEIPKHGPIRHTEFHLKEQTESSVTFSITQEDIPANMYPYLFELLVTYTLEEKTLHFSITVHNKDSKSIAYCLGLHPAIHCPLYPNETFEDYVLRFPEKQLHGYRGYDLEVLQFDMSCEHPFPSHDNTDIPLTHSLFKKDAIWFDRPTSREVSIINPTTGKGIHASYPEFETIAFWTKCMKEATYVCIEPWNGSAACSDEDNEFLHKNHVQTLEQNASKTYRLDLTILNE